MAAVRLVPLVKLEHHAAMAVEVAVVAQMGLILQMAEPVAHRAEVAVVPQYALILLGGALVAQAREAKLESLVGR